MRPYGWKRNMYRDEDMDITSKHGNMKSKNKRKFRQIRNGWGRNEGKREIAEQVRGED